MSDERPLTWHPNPVNAETDKTTQDMGKCTTPTCPGDPRYASPGRGHLDVCTYPIPYDGDEIPEWRETEGMTEAMAPFMTLVLLFGAAVQGATRDEKKALYEARLLLTKKAPLAEVAQAVMDARGPDWEIPTETLAAIEALHQPKDSE